MFSYIKSESYIFFRWENTEKYSVLWKKMLAWNFNKKDLWNRSFSVNYAKLLRAPFCIKPLRWLLQRVLSLYLVMLYLRFAMVQSWIKYWRQILKMLRNLLAQLPEIGFWLTSWGLALNFNLFLEISQFSKIVKQILHSLFSASNVVLFHFWWREILLQIYCPWLCEFFLVFNSLKICGNYKNNHLLGEKVKASNILPGCIWNGF